MGGRARSLRELALESPLLEPAIARPDERDGVRRRVAVANPARDGSLPTSDNKSVEGLAVPGFLVEGTIENGKESCTEADGCAGDTSSIGHTFSGHTANDVVLSALGPGAWQFSGTYENTDVFIRMLRATTGDWSFPGAAPGRRPSPSDEGRHRRRPIAATA